MGSESGVALASALKENTTLLPFTCNARVTSMGNGSGVALARAIKENILINEYHG